MMMQPGQDSYAAPKAQVDETTPLPSVRIWRILAYGVLIFAVVMAIYFISGLTFGQWEIYGATMERAIVNARWVWRIVGWLAAFGLYLIFLHGATGRHLFQVLAVFVVVQVVDMTFTALSTLSVKDLFY